MGIGEYFNFLLVRHLGDINALTGYVIEQVIDEFNRSVQADYGAARVPPGEDDVEGLFPNGGNGCRKRVSSCPLLGTTWPRRCGGGLVCG